MNKWERFRAKFLPQDLLQNKTPHADDDDYAPLYSLRFSDFLLAPKIVAYQMAPKCWACAAKQIKSEFGFLRPQLHLFKFNFILAALTCAFITAGMAYKVDLEAPIKAGQRKSISPKRSAFELRICEHVPGASAIHSAQASKQLTWN